ASGPAARSRRERIASLRRNAPASTVFAVGGCAAHSTPGLRPNQCGLRTADCGFIEDCGVRIADYCGFPIADYGLWVVDCGLWIVDLARIGQSAINPQSVFRNSLRTPHFAINPHSAIRNPHYTPCP